MSYAMTDRDSHEFMELEKAIKKYFINAIRGRCSWHIINKGWIRYSINEKIVPQNQQHALKQAVRTLSSK